MTKFYAQEKRVFDISKVTVVGSPTITSDGIIYNTSNADNYVLLPCDFTKDFTIELDYQDKNDGKYWWGFIVHGVFEIYHYQQSNKIQINWRNSGSNYKTICNIDYVSGATYHFQLKRVGNTVFVKGYINNVLNNEASLDITDMQVTNTNVRILNQNYIVQDTTQYKPIEVDLTTVKITQNDTTFSPTKPICYLERRKEGFDLSKFTVVGSPTITDDGVASGFSTSNYIVLIKDTNICICNLHIRNI